MGNQILNKKKMKYSLIAVVATVAARHHHHPHNIENVMIPRIPYQPVGLGHEVIPANREDYNNADSLWKKNWLPTLKLTLTTKIAPLPNPTTGRVLNNAPNPGNAEALECAKEEDGAPDMTVARELHSQNKHQVSPTINDRR